LDGDSRDYPCIYHEAFDGRGKGDYLASHDIEDIIAVLDGRPVIVDEVKRAEPDLIREL
jgi:hypothetical protein